MYFTVHIKPSGYFLFVDSNETILEAALKQGYRFPFDCENGVCGTCRGQILSGSVRYEEDYLPALSDDEREEGFALFCSAKPTSDLTIQIDHVVGPEKIPIKKLIYTVEKFETLSESIDRVFLKPPENNFLRYRAGQYLNILHRDESPKPFSFANAPSENKIIEIHIQRSPKNPYADALIQEIKTENKLHLQGPYGNCILRNAPPYPVIFLAGGAGFAPIKALIEQALTEKISRPIYLYWGARKISDFYLDSLAQEWQKNFKHFHYIPVLSGDDKNWKGKMGWVHETVIENHPDLSQCHIYASGPTEMVYAALHAFQSHGLNRALIYSDTFDYPNN